MATNATSDFSNPSNPSTTSPGLDAYVEKLIGTTVSRLVRHGSILRCDREDWEQDLRIAVLESLPAFDPKKATWHTFVNPVVRRAVQMKIRQNTAGCRNDRDSQSMDHLPEAAASVAQLVDPLGNSDVDRQDNQELVGKALASLTGDARLLAETLLELGPMEARRQLGWTWRRYYPARDAIEVALRRLGAQGA